MDGGVPEPALVNATTGRFANAAPVAGPQFSLPGLNSQFSSTFPQQASNASTQWMQTSQFLTETVASLDGAKASLGSSATTSWVQAAIERINQIQWAGGTYAGHAEALAGHTANLAAVAQANQINTAVAHGTWLMLPTMEQKIAFERAYLAPFAPNLTTSLVPVNPVFNQLLPPLSDMPGDEYKPEAVSVPRTPEFEKTPLPRVVADALSQRGFNDLARASTPTEVIEQFDAITPDTLGALSEGATPTQAAAVAAPSMPPTLNPGAGLGAGGTGWPGNGATGVGGASTAPLMAGNGAFGPGLASAAQRGAPAGLGAPGAVPRGGTAGAWAGGVPNPGVGRPLGGRLPAPGGGVGLHGGSFGAGGFPGAVGGGAGKGARTGGVPGTGVGGGIPGAGVGGPGAGAGGSSRVAGVPGASGASANSNPARAYPVGGPAGAASRGVERDRKANRVKAVTSAVERDGNLRALLGEAPALLPDVIGDNVKQPRR